MYNTLHSIHSGMKAKSGLYLMELSTDVLSWDNYKNIQNLPVVPVILHDIIPPSIHTYLHTYMYAIFCQV